LAGSTPWGGLSPLPKIPPAPPRNPPPNPPAPGERSGRTDTAAVYTGLGGPTVTVKTQTGDVRMAVTTGMQGDQGVEIKSGLTAGLTVVLP
jgi:hypothetical protein